MHEEKIALVDGQVKAVQQAVAARAVENVYFVACGGSLATLYPGKYILERETAAERAWWCSIPKAAARRRPPRRHGWPPGAAR